MFAADQAEIDAHFSKGASFAALAIAARQVANTTQGVALNPASGGVYQPKLLECMIKDPRPVGAPDAAGTIMNVDLCDCWRGLIMNVAVDVVQTIPPTYAPRTTRLQFTDAMVMATSQPERACDDVCR